MKKNILTGAVFTALSFASYAQNTVSVNQAGTNQTVKATQRGTLQSATINQMQGSGENTENYAETNQSGNGTNTILINQLNDASLNKSVIVQKGGIGNTAKTEQNGENSYYSNANWTFITQDGNSNLSTVKQNTNSRGNLATINQQYNSNFNKSSIEQSSSSYDNQAAITQSGGAEGVGHEARIEQIGETGESNDNKATIKQSNLGNKALITQNAISSRRSFSNTAYSQQDGIYGSVIINQNTPSMPEYNEVKVVQTVTSVNSKATVEQDAPYGGNVTDVLQTGTGEASIKQTGYNSYAAVRQAGGYLEKNVATIYQNTGHSWADIYQAGNNNKATINQQSTYQNYAFVEQSQNVGNSNNKAFINQQSQYSMYSSSAAVITQGTELTAATNSQASLTQGFGEANEAYLLQTGNQQTASISQTGYTNLIFGTPGTRDAAQQSGDHNKLTVTQTSSSTDGMYSPNNIVYAIQVGSSNQATIIQSAN